MICVNANIPTSEKLYLFYIEHQPGGTLSQLKIFCRVYSKLSISARFLTLSKPLIMLYVGNTNTHTFTSLSYGQILSSQTLSSDKVKCCVTKLRVLSADRASLHVTKHFDREAMDK